ncbi:heavy metal translocating P-type ATPase [Membranihabitans maritimus]|uniref:heavy metal translocating P-type ATPase n=1 Tax=Membranihabitans maritimus TaxID=2904244 RepID=UPI001F455819|nr:heavy metal translocating P-type ATPase metal-binding domain-containing protein [Membranihabitans maritimus]
MEINSALNTVCYHCGDRLPDNKIVFDNKKFCCQGCQTVYSILKENDLCSYYHLNGTPGITKRKEVHKEKYLFLNDPKISKSFVDFKDDISTKATFSIPSIHCSSCLWLLEKLHNIESGIRSSRVDFARKKVSVIFDHNIIDLKQVAELLTSIGYEPYISFDEDRNKTYDSSLRQSRRDLLNRLGVAGFCFGNIMLASLPEYFSGINSLAENWAYFFRYFNLLLAIPVFFYSSLPFFRSAGAGIRKGVLNIDIPVSIAIIITFIRSLVEVIGGYGSGFFDSMAGIVFFMLIGRYLREKAQNNMVFDRDYRSYFPLAVNRVEGKLIHSVSLSDLRKNDIIRLHSGDIVPADSLVLGDAVLVNYSFVTGESHPVRIQKGGVLYAGGRIVKGLIELSILKPVSQSYLVSLWNDYDASQEGEENHSDFVNFWGIRFTYLVLLIAVASAIYWGIFDPSKMWTSATAVLIIACPCALLLASTYADAQFIRHFSLRKVYLKNAKVFSELRKVSRIVFDKTGTITQPDKNAILYRGQNLSTYQQRLLKSLALESVHPISKGITKYFEGIDPILIDSFNEIPGKGIEGWIDNHHVQIGSRDFAKAFTFDAFKFPHAFVNIDGKALGYFKLQNVLRPEIINCISRIKENNTKISLLSGDNEGERVTMENLLGNESDIRFSQSPHDKKEAVKAYQKDGESVLMVGDGLNDAGALKSANVGVVISEDSQYFTPACDIIVDSESIGILPDLTRLAIWNKRLVTICFIFSLGYNFTGLWFAVQGLLSPLMAAIIMPLSSLTIIALTYVGAEMVFSDILTKRKR